MLCILEILVALVVLAVIVVGVYIKAQGDAEMLVEVGKRTTAVKVAEDGERLDFEVEVPYRNAGKQEGTIIDAYMRIYLPQEQYADVLLRGKVNLKGVKRDDDYFEAVLVPEGTGKTLLLRFEAYAKNGKTIAEAINGMPDVDIALYADCRGRGALFTVKEFLTLSAEEMRALVK
ncbi:MAG: hypothetical protein MJ050_06725 [Phascolarctobacterium sp.]|nr:hypothetical protein [Phascolarctobacterium sp.]